MADEHRIEVYDTQFYCRGLFPLPQLNPHLPLTYTPCTVYTIYAVLLLHSHCVVYLLIVAALFTMVLQKPLNKK